MMFTFSLNIFAEDGFTQADRERIIRTEVTLQQFMKSSDKRFEDMNNTVNNRLQDMNNFLLIVISIFAATAGGVFVYIIWDRKTFMSVALQNAKVMVDTELNTLQKEGKLNDLINAMRELANDDPKVRTVLSRFHLL